MKSPICSFDANTGVLCSNCEEKLESGAISPDDVYAATRLTRIADRNQEINKFTLVRGIRVDGDLILVLRSPDVSILRGNPALGQMIESEFGQKVWFVESEASDRRFMENLFHPAKVLSVNLFWLPDGNKLTKVMASGNPEKQRVNTEKVQKIAKAVRNIELLVEFEKQH
ncbi:MAG: transcription elongation factor NusA [Nitrososphaera sp.]